MSRFNSLFLFCCSAPAFAQSGVTPTNIHDTLYTLGNFAETCDIAIQGGIVVPGGLIYVGSSTFAISNLKATVRSGVLDVNLIPNDSTTPVNTRYRTSWSCSDNSAFTQIWNVPTSSTSVKLRDVIDPAGTGSVPVVQFPLALLASGGATNGQAVVFNGTNWAPATLNYLASVMTADGDIVVRRGGVTARLGQPGDGTWCAHYASSVMSWVSCPAGTYTATAPLTLTAGAFGMQASGVTAGTYGSATQVPQITYDSFGRATSVTNVPIAGGGNMSVTTGTGAPTAACTVGQSLYVDTSATPRLLYWCDTASGIWQMILSTLGSGETLAGFTEGPVPTALPPSGTQFLFINQANHHASLINSSGTVADLQAGGGGTITGATTPGALFTSPVAVTGGNTLAFALITQSANTVLAGPVSGSAAAPAMRALVPADIPALAESAVTGLTADLAGKAPLAAPGKLWFAPHGVQGGGVINSLAVHYVYLTPFTVENAYTAGHIMVPISTGAASGKVVAAIFNTDASGVCTTLIRQTGSIAADTSNSFPVGTFTSPVAMTRGDYCTGLMTDSVGISIVGNLEYLYNYVPEATVTATTTGTGTGAGLTMPSSAGGVSNSPTPRPLLIFKP